MGGYWALRALVFGVCATILVVLIVTACTQDPAVRFISPTIIPSLTLTLSLNRALSPPYATIAPVVSPSGDTDSAPSVYLAQAHDTLQDISAAFGLSVDTLTTANPQLPHLPDAALPLGQRVIIPQATPNSDVPALTFTVPHCVPTEPEHLLCLGSVFNPLAHPVTDVRLRVMLTRDDSTVIAQSVTLEQWRITPQSRAAYAVRFTLPPRTTYHSPSVTLLSASPAAPTDARLTLTHDPPRITNGRYVFTASAANLSAQPAESVRVFATVYDASARVVGYRVLEVGTLEAHALRAFSMDVPLVSIDGPLRLVLDIEARER